MIGLGLLELTPLALGVYDLAAQPTNKIYGGFEIAVGGAALALNTYWVADGLERADSGDYTVAAGLAILDAAVVAHGIYTLARKEEERPRYTLTPTMVSDGKTSAPGFGLGGSF